MFFFEPIFFKSNSKLFGLNYKITWKTIMFIESKIDLFGLLQKINLFESNKIY